MENGIQGGKILESWDPCCGISNGDRARERGEGGRASRDVRIRLSHHQRVLLLRPRHEDKNRYVASERAHHGANYEHDGRRSVHYGDVGGLSIIGKRAVPETKCRPHQPGYRRAPPRHPPT